MKDNSYFELKTSLNHMSEPKCRRGLNLDPMVQVTDKPCHLTDIKTLVYYSLDTRAEAYNLSAG
jgi:hypothetical protein